MAIVRENYTGASLSSTGTGTLSFSATLSGTNRALFVGFHVEYNTSVSSVEINSVSMTLIKNQVYNTNNQSWIYGLLDASLPANGTYTVTITMSGSGATLYGGYAQYSGCKQTALPTGTAVKGNTSIASATFPYNFAPVSLDDSAWAFTYAKLNDAAQINGTGNTLLSTAITNFVAMGDSNGALSTAGTQVVDLNAATSSRYWGACCVFSPSVTASTPQNALYSFGGM